MTYANDFYDVYDFYDFNLCRWPFGRIIDMPDEDFHVHLISNVAPNIFPDNNPSEFSTPLANEIDLSGGQWEVAVRQIMYPTHISTTSPKDKIFIREYKMKHRNLLPYPPQQMNSVFDYGVKIPIQPGKVTKGQLINAIVQAVNTSEWKGIVNLEYNNLKNKFALHVLKEDIVAVMTPEMQKSLGFSESCFTKGSYWAKAIFKKSMTVPEDFIGALHLLDLQTLQKEKHTLLVQMDNIRKHRIYEKTVPHLFKDTVPDELISEPKFSFSVRPNEGCIKINSLQPDIMRNFGAHENPLVFFRFDEKSTKALQLDNLYYLQEEKEFKIPIVKPPKASKAKEEVTATIAVTITSTNAAAKAEETEKKEEAKEPEKKKTKKEEAAASEGYVLDQIHAIEVEFFYLSRRDGMHIRLLDQPVGTMELKPRPEIKDPEKLIPDFLTLAGHYDYDFKWLSDVKRFAIHVNSPKYAVSLTKGLASVLGFDPNKEFFGPGVHVARDSPVLNRNITALYVYTNIVNPVYVGDVKAPLLLTCPFKTKGSNELVDQQEFLNPTYTPINRTTIDQINIAIYDDAGDLIPFLHGKTKLSLHFRKRPLH